MKVLLKIILALILFTVGANLISTPDDLTVISGLFLAGVATWLIYSLLKPLSNVFRKPTKTRKKTTPDAN